MSASNKLKNFVPLLDRVLIQRIKPETKTAAGIYIPEKAQEALNQGHVIAVGKGLLNKKGEHVATQVAVGDKVILPPFGGSEIKISGEEYLLFRDLEILAKVVE